MAVARGPCHHKPVLKHGECGWMPRMVGPTQLPRQAEGSVQGAVPASAIDGGQHAAHTPHRHFQRFAHRALAHVAQGLLKELACSCRRGAAQRSGRHSSGSRASASQSCTVAEAHVFHSYGACCACTTRPPAAPGGSPRTCRVGPLCVRVAGLHKGLHLLQVAQLDEVQAAPLQLVVVELHEEGEGANVGLVATASTKACSRWVRACSL